MKSISAIDAAAGVLAGGIELTYAHDMAGERPMVVIRPVCRTAFIASFQDLAANADGCESSAIEAALNAAARTGADADYARVRKALLQSFWTRAIGRQNPNLLDAAVAALATQGTMAA